MKENTGLKKIKLPILPYGEGSMSIRENGKVMYRKNIGNPKRTRVVYGSSPKECISKMRQLEQELLEMSSSSNLTLTEAMNKWLYTTKQNKLKPQSYQRLESTIRNQIEPSKIGSMRYQLLDSEEIQSVIQDLIRNRYSYSTIKKTYDALNDFYRYASIKDKFSNPMLLVTAPTKNNVKVEAKQIEFFEQEDIEKFIMECGVRHNTGTMKYRYGYAIAANIYLGMRIGELLALRWKDIDFERNTIYVCKTLIECANPKYDKSQPNAMREHGIKKTIYSIQNSTKMSKNRYVPMNTRAKQLLLKHLEVSEYKEEDDFVISTRNRRTSTIKNISDTIRQIEIAADTQVQSYGTHILRHTCASLYFRKNVPIVTIAKILGHSVEVCEKTYIHFVEEQMKEAASQIDVIEV